MIIYCSDTEAPITGVLFESEAQTIINSTLLRINSWRVLTFSDTCLILLNVKCSADIYVLAFEQLNKIVDSSSVLTESGTG